MPRRKQIVSDRAPASDSSPVARLSRRALLEHLEPRQVLTTSLGAISDVSMLAGAPIHIALDGLDTEGDALSFEVTSTGSGSGLTTLVPQGNRSMKISVAGHGDMVFELFEGRAPRTTSRIIELADSNFYDGIIFHRIIENFMIQGGDPTGTGSGGSGTDFDDEFHPDLVHTTSGVLSMAKSSDDTNDSQFFITSLPTRHLDFNHSIFGQLTEGDDVRQQIAAVAVGASDKPNTPVVMESVTVFEDTENAVLMLKADPGTTGTFEVSVTARDVHGNEAQRTFNVTVAGEDATNNTPFLSPIEPVITTVNQPVEIQLTATDVEGDWSFFGGWSLSEWPRTSDFTGELNDLLEVEVDSLLGKVTITPKEGLVGVHGVLFGTGAYDVNTDTYDPRQLSSTWDLQFVPVMIYPETPTIELAPGSDTPSDGITPTDNVTSTDLLADEGKSLVFWVSKVAAGAQLSLVIDDVEVAVNEVGRSKLSDGTYHVSLALTDPSVLADGAHQVTVTQTLSNVDVAVGNVLDVIDMESGISQALELVVDNTPPAITSTPVPTASEGKRYEYDVEAIEEADGSVSYRLVIAPTGMVIGGDTGEIGWTPTASQAGSHTIKVRATDKAGFVVEQEFDVEVGEAPRVAPIPDKTIDESETLDVTPLASGGTGTYQFSLDGTVPTGATLNSQTGQIIWIPSESQGSTNQLFRLRVTDANGATSVETFRVNVREVNQAPTLRTIPNRVVDEGADIVLNLQSFAEDLDQPANRLTYELLEGPAGALIDPSSGIIRWVPDESQGGVSHAFTVRVSDGLATSAERTFTLDVQEVYLPPRFDPIAPMEAAVGEALRFQVHAEDRDVPTRPVEYSLNGPVPDGLELDADTGQVVWNVPDDHPGGIVSLTIRATEVTPPGEPAGTATLNVSVEVFNPLLAMVDEILAQTIDAIDAIAAVPTNPSLLLLATTPETADASSVSQPASEYADRGLFAGSIFDGSFIPDTSLGGDLPPSIQEEEDPESNDAESTPDEGEPGNEEIPRGHYDTPPEEIPMDDASNVAPKAPTDAADPNVADLALVALVDQLAQVDPAEPPGAGEAENE